MTHHHLYIGNKFTGIIVARQHNYPSPWRIHWPDRQPSDIVNLARAKDAAMQWAARLERDKGNHTAAHLLPVEWRHGQNHQEARICSTRA